MATAKPKMKVKKGKKLTKTLEGVVAMGLKKEPTQKGEVAGHMSPGMWYGCPNCYRTSWVPPGYTFYCCAYCRFCFTV
jgi:hypothetical protein